MYLHVNTVIFTIIQYLIGGLAHTDISDWKKHTELKGYLPNDDVIVWFWDVCVHVHYIENYN